MTHSTVALARNKSQQFAVPNIDSIFNFRKPKPPLSDFIDSFWIYEGQQAEAKVERILPTGTLELAINLRQNNLGFFYPDHPEKRLRLSGSVVSGAHGRSFTPEPAREVSILGAHFKPGGAFPFLGLSAGDLADTHADLETLWGPFAGRLRERLCEASTQPERFQLLEEALMDRLCLGVKHHYAVSAALEMFARRQVGPRIKEAAKYLGLSQRRFIQLFKAQVGMTPKLFSRIQRFQQSRSLISQYGSSDWVDIALKCGYFDQSHLIREFRELSGVSPAAYLRQYRQTSRATDTHV